MPGDALPAYRRKIYERQERETWPSQVEVVGHPNMDGFLQENNCDSGCPHLYECVVVKMKCWPFARRLWLSWKRGGLKT